MRVLVCGSRDWGTNGIKTDPWHPTEPQFDPKSFQSHLTIALLDGLYTEDSIGYAVSHLDPFVIIHGCAPGADSVAWWWAEQAPTHSYEEEKFQHEPYPAKWFDEDGEFRRWAGPERNKLMLEEGQPDLVLAFTNDIKNSKGTRNMCQIAKEAGVKVVVIGEFNAN